MTSADPYRPPYAKVGGPPARWKRLVVLDAVTREQITDVREANAVEGWFVQVQRGAGGKLVKRGSEAVTKRVERPIIICDVCADPDARDPSKPIPRPQPASPPLPPRTPEDGQRPSTPEDGQSVTTR